MNSIKVRGLSFTYKGAEKKSLKGIDFDQNKGELVVMMGPTGAGKSTFSRTLNSLIPQFQRGELSGEIEILGRTIKGSKVCQTAKKVGLVFQDFENQLFSTNVALEVAFGPENFSRPREEISRRVKKSLAMVGLEGYEKREPHALSGGEKQRLAIASILSIDPEILVMDEPTADLDPMGKYHLLQIANSLKAQGRTLLIMETEAEEVLEADRIVLFNKGKLIVQGTPQEIFADPALLEENSLRPPQLVKLFKELKIPEAPFTVEDADSILKDRGVSLSQARYQLLKEKSRIQPDGETIFSLKGLKFTYPDGQEALKGVEFEVREGEFLAILGQNGSGKTTLIKHFNGLLRPTSGKVFYQGEDIRGKNIRELGREIGYVFQNPDHQIFSDTVREEVCFALKNYGFSQDETSRRLKDALEVVHLEGYEEEDPFSLTRGERQRLAVASVLILRPKVLILDEPTTGLDYQELRGIMELLKGLHKKGHTIIIITHSMWIVAEYAHRAVIMSEGKVVMDSSVRDVFSREIEIEKLSLKLPPIVSLSHKFGKSLLSVEEFKFCLES